MGLGLNVAVEDIIDVARFRKEFFFGLVLEHATTEGDYLAAASRWLEVPAGVCPPQTPEAARELIQSTLWGNVPDSVVRQHLLYQLDRLGTQLGLRLEMRRIAMKPTDASTGVYDELRPRLPWVRSNSVGKLRIEVPGPVLSVSRIRAVTYGTTAWTSTSHAVVDVRGGVIVLNDWPLLLTSPGGTTYLAPERADNANLFRSVLRLLDVDTLPDFWAVDYTTGPITNGEVGKLPISLQYQVYCQTAIFLLALHSNVTTKGVSNQSRNVDGVSNSVSLTNTAMYDVNSALEIILDKYGDKLDIKVMRRRLRGVPCYAL